MKIETIYNLINEGILTTFKSHWINYPILIEISIIKGIIDVDEYVVDICSKLSYNRLIDLNVEFSINAVEYINDIMLVEFIQFFNLEGRKIEDSYDTLMDILSECDCTNYIEHISLDYLYDSLLDYPEDVPVFCGIVDASTLPDAKKHMLINLANRSM